MRFLKVTSPDITLSLSFLVWWHPWKKFVRGMSSPRLQHTTGGGLNAFRASKPVLFPNKLNEPPLFSHLLTHAPTQTHTGTNTCLDMAGLTCPHVSCQLITFFSVPDMDWMWATTMQKTWMNQDPSHVYTHWLTDTNSVSVEIYFVQPSTVFDQVRASSLKWRLSLHNTWLCESCSNQSSPQPSPVQAEYSWMQWLVLIMKIPRWD